MKKESAGGIIVNENNEIVMVFTDSQSWQFPKGTVWRNEEYLATALREIKEETKLKDLKLIKELPVYTRPSMDEKGKKCIRDIHYFLFQTKKRDLQASAEVTACEWVPIDKVLDRITYPEDKEFFRKIKEGVRFVKSK
jgi:8-oxo-dGTP pyrophosphatase MutT (NUDIX family)